MRGPSTALTILPPLAIDGHTSSGHGHPDHPMRRATRRAAGLDPGGWTKDLQREVVALFDGMAAEWHTRSSPERLAVVMDALDRGLGRTNPATGLAVEVGSGTGHYSGALARRFRRVVAVDVSLEMLRLAPAGPGHRVLADAATLPLADRTAAAVVLINAFLFPAEVDRVLAPDGVLVWVNSSGEQTPIYLPPDDLLKALPGPWTGTTSRAGAGMWTVLRRAA